MASNMSSHSLERLTKPSQGNRAGTMQYGQLKPALDMSVTQIASGPSRPTASSPTAALRTSLPAPCASNLGTQVNRSNNSQQSAAWHPLEFELVKHQQQVTDMITGMQTQQATFMSETKETQQSLEKTIMGHILAVTAKLDAFTTIQLKILGVVERLEKTSYTSMYTPGLCNQEQKLPDMLSTSTSSRDPTPAGSHDQYIEFLEKSNDDYADRFLAVTQSINGYDSPKQHHNQDTVMHAPKVDHFSMDSTCYSIQDFSTHNLMSTTSATIMDDSHVLMNLPSNSAAGLANVSGHAAPLQNCGGAAGEGKAALFIREQMSRLTQVMAQTCNTGGNQQLETNSSSRSPDLGYCLPIPEEQPHEVSH